MIDHAGKSQQENYPSLTVSRDGDAIVVRIPVRFHRRNGRQIVLAHGDNNGQATPEREPNASLAKAYRWQEQLESGEYASLEDLAAANGVDRTYECTALATVPLALWAGCRVPRFRGRGNHRVPRTGAPTLPDNRASSAEKRESREETAGEKGRAKSLWLSSLLSPLSCSIAAERQWRRPRRLETGIETRRRDHGEY